MTTLNETMTSRERLLAALDMKTVDRLPFWPKLGGSYQPMQTGRFAEMDNPAVHRYVGSDGLNWIPRCFKVVRGNSSFESRNADDNTRQLIFKTNGNELESTLSFDPASRSWHPMTFPVKTREDISILAEYWRDIRIEPDEDALEEANARITADRDAGIWTDGIGESPLMYFVEHLAGIVNAHYFLVDCPDEVEDLFDAIHSELLRKAEIVADKSPADGTYLTENTSTTLISPEQYAKYCYHHIKAYGSIIEGAGKRVILHMCGHLKGLLDQLNELPVHAFEAFTSPTLGNTTLLDGRSGCPNTCLIGGTNATLWLEPADKIIAQVEKDLDALPHHRGIVVTSAGVMPPYADPDRIKTVCEWVKSYPVKN